MSGTVDKPQHLQALENANAVRRKQFAALREIKSGASIASVLFSEDSDLGSIPVERLLRAVRGWGSYRVASCCRRLGINERRPIRRLTDRQKVAILRENPGGRERGSRPDTTVPRALIEAEADGED